MMELFYPFESAPVVGEKAPLMEMLPVVDNVGRVYAQSSRANCHNPREPLLHPVVHLEIVDRYSRFYLQRRSENKEKYPLLWDVAVGGHVTYGELFEDALYREAWEELRFSRFNPQYLSNYIYEGGGELEMVNLYVAVGSFHLTPDNYEVRDGKYWTIEEIESSLGSGVFTPNFETEYMEYRDKILALL